MGKKLFARKPGGTKVGNALRSVFGKKKGGSTLGNVARSVNPFVRKPGGSKTGNAGRSVVRGAKKLLGGAKNIVKKNPNKKSKPKKKSRWDGSFRKTL